MKRLFLIASIVLFSLQSFSQGDAVISGRLFDKETKIPVAFATISVVNKSDGKLVTGAITSDDGRFSVIGLPQGEFIITCSFVGYTPVTFEILIGRLNKVFDLGRIELEAEATSIGEVSVTAAKNMVAVAADKKSFDIAGNISQAGGSALDVMRNLPGITIDQDQKVELRGSDKVLVLIDGKQSSLTGFGNQKGLASIPASSIERIEIINNPSAKYDVTGMAGIINIIYKKETNTGLTADIGFSYGLGNLTKRKDDLPSELGSYSVNPKYIPSLNVNYRREKINLFLQSEVLFQHRLPNNEFTTRYYDDGTTTASQVPENRKQTQYIIKGGLDYFLNEKNTVTFSMIYDYESHHDTAQVPYVSLPSMERYRYWNWLEYEITGFMNYSLAWKHKFPEPGRELNTSIQYTKGWEDETYNLHDSSDIRISGDFTNILAIEHTANFQLDYVKPLKRGRLESGFKLQARRIPVTYTTEGGAQSIIYPGLGDWSDWGEDIFSDYMNWVHETKKIDIEAGLRFEKTWVFYNLSPENIYYSENDSYSYFKIYPNIRLTYKINDNNRITAYINKRVDRPGEPELRVFPKYDDPELLKVGNPYLRPQFTNTAELAYKLGWANGSFSLSAYYKYITDPFIRIYSIDTTNVSYDIVNKIYHNVGSATNSGTELILSQKVTDFWNISASCNLYKNVIATYQDTLLFPYKRGFAIEKTTDTSADIKINNLFTVKGLTRIQVTFMYYSPKNIPQGKQLARSSLDIGVTRKVLKSRGEVSFSFTDMLNDFGIRQELKDVGFSALYENYFETQIVSIGFKYKFQ